MHTKSPIEIAFDFISPYAYIGWKRIHAVAESHGRAVTPVPVLFAAMLNFHGTKGPAEVPARRVYVFKDATRKAHRAGLGPLIPPPSHPYNPLLALRVATIPMPAVPQRALIDALFHAAWGGGGGVETPAAVSAVARSVGLDGEALIAQANTPEIKERLRKNTESAIARGAFGVPSFFVDGELFFGVDSLELIADFLEGRDPVTNGLLSRWAELPASAQREAR